MNNGYMIPFMDLNAFYSKKNFPKLLLKIDIKKLNLN